MDTGAGFERWLMLLQGVPTVMDVDIMQPLLQTAQSVTGRTYGLDPEDDWALRVLADHTRTMAFLVNDGVIPSNEDRGYVLRRLIRRAVRFAYLLGVNDLVLPSLVGTCIDTMGDAYPDLAASSDAVIGIIEREEGGFRSTLSRRRHAPRGDLRQPAPPRCRERSPSSCTTPSGSPSRSPRRWPAERGDRGRRQHASTS